MTDYDIAFHRWSRPSDPPLSTAAALKTLQLALADGIVRDCDLAGVPAESPCNEQIDAATESLVENTLHPGQGRAAGIPPSRRHGAPILPSAESAASSTNRILPDLSNGALRRCVPYPHRHTSVRTTDNSNTRPTRSLVSIQYSFVDDPPGQGEGEGEDANSFPIAKTRLVPGRRGSWLLPISNALPIPHATRPSWPGRAESTSASHNAIIWTTPRLRALWDTVTRIHNLATLGDLRASCFFASTSPHASDAPSSLPVTWPDHIRVSVDGAAALSLRKALGMVSAWPASAPVKDRAVVRAPPEELFLKHVKLVWVDEEGNAVLLA